MDRVDNSLNKLLSYSTDWNCTSPCATQDYFGRIVWRHLASHRHTNCSVWLILYQVNHFWPSSISFGQTNLKGSLHWKGYRVCEYYEPVSSCLSEFEVSWKCFNIEHWMDIALSSFHFRCLEDFASIQRKCPSLIRHGSSLLFFQFIFIYQAHCTHKTVS